MALEFIKADDEGGYFSNTIDTDVFVNSGVLLSSPTGPAMALSSADHDVTVQGAVVGDSYGIILGSDLSAVTNSSLSVAEGGLVAGNEAARLYGSSYQVTNNGDIMGELRGLALFGDGGASTIENFGLISAESNAIVIGDLIAQDVTLRNTGEIAGGDLAYSGGAGIDRVVNRGVMDGNIVLGEGNDVYNGSLGVLAGSVSGGEGNDRIIGGANNTLVNGGAGTDNLTGGGGDDRFYFSDTLGASNVDPIHDFWAPDDRIRLDDAVFSQIVGTGKLSDAQFAANTSGVATQADDRIIYETDTGKLFYDSNGSEGGGRTLFVVLSDAPAITAADFLVV